MTYNKMKISVGLFIILFFFNIAVLTYYVLNEKGMFDQRYSYKFTTFSADPFSIGMPIKISGFKIGYIDSIELKENGSVDISFSVNYKNQKWILQKSIIMIQKPLIGTTQLILYPSIGNLILEEGAYLEVYESDDINELVYKLKPIVEKMGNILDSVDKITSYLAKDDSELVKIIKNTEKFSALLANNRSILTAITGDPKATNDLIATINQLPLLMKNFNTLSLDIQKQIVPQVSTFLKELEKIAQDVNTKLKKLDGVVNSVSSYEGEILDIKDDIKEATFKSNEILEKVNSLLPGSNKNELSLP